MYITVLSVVDQETGRSVVTRPVESRSSALNDTLSCPTTRLAVSGTTVTVATGSGEPTTWIVSEPLSPPLVAVIVAYPGWLPVTVAVSLTPVATIAWSQEAKSPVKHTVMAAFLMGPGDAVSPLVTFPAIAPAAAELIARRFGMKVKSGFP